MQREDGNPRAFVRTESVGHTSLIEVRGEVDVSNIETFRATLRNTVSGDHMKAVVISLQGMTYIDSSMLNELMSFVRSVDGHLSVAIVRPSYSTGQRILDIFGLSSFVQIFDGVQDAMSFVEEAK